MHKCKCKSLTFCSNATIHETSSWCLEELLGCPSTWCWILHCLMTRWLTITNMCSLSEKILHRLWKWPNALLQNNSRGKQTSTIRRSKVLQWTLVTVLLANKIERGKRKTADRWESHIYIVTGMNSEVHTFRIRNTATGTEKVVHINLIMPVNFLPLRNEVSDVETCENVTSSRPSLSENEELSLPVNELDDRIGPWVSELPVSQDAGPSESDFVQLKCRWPAYFPDCTTSYRQQWTDNWNWLQVFDIWTWRWQEHCSAWWRCKYWCFSHWPCTTMFQSTFRTGWVTDGQNQMWEGA